MDTAPRRSLKQQIARNQNLIWASFFALLSLLLSNLLYFQENPLFEYPFLGEVVESIGIFLLIYFYGGLVSRAISRWFENVVAKTITNVMNDIWKAQNDRIADQIAKERTAQEEEVSKYKHVVLDTSAIIDGRIFGVINTGFLDNVIVIPQNVLDELQNMADRSDPFKRQKGRRGLDNLRDVRKQLSKDKFRIVEIESSADTVDKTLVAFCKEKSSKLATLDYNLNKIAQIAGVQVLNVNKLANEIKINLLPGDTVLLKLVQKGTEEGQAVGYLEDGTMIVVNNATEFIKSEREVVIDKALQTSAGKMLFASLVRLASEDEDTKQDEKVKNGAKKRQDSEPSVPEGRFRNVFFTRKKSSEREVLVPEK